MELVFIIFFFLLGVIIGSILFYQKLKYYRNSSQNTFNDQNKELNSVQIELVKIRERYNLLEESYAKAGDELNNERKISLKLSGEISAIRENRNYLEQKLQEQKKEIETLYLKLNKDFEILANKIIEEKSEKFTIQNKQNLDTILNPLNEKIKEFQKKIEETYDKESQQRSSLKTEITKLYELNIQMTKEANNLTQALKGQSKTQGNWGEVILDSILEKSGLVKGREYISQTVITDETGTKLQPDVIVYLPDKKCLIIDSKCSLVAYERYCSVEMGDEKIRYLKDHIYSIRKHIKELSQKNYHNLYQLRSLDFVLMFLPVEPAFSLAVQNEIGLFNEAFEKNIVIVSPSTLLATLRTIASIWRQENQNRNALEIAQQGGALYDKFQGLINDLIDIGKKMRSAQETYEEAMKKLNTGRGNLIGSVEKLKSLGAKTTKSLPQNLLERLEDDGEEPQQEQQQLF